MNLTFPRTAGWLAMNALAATFVSACLAAPAHSETSTPAATGVVSLPYHAAFERSPLHHGWRWLANSDNRGFNQPRFGQAGWHHETSNAAAAEPDAPPHIWLVGGQWQSPLWAFGSHRYVQLTLDVQAAREPSWVVYGYDASGRRMLADFYSELTQGHGQPLPDQDGWARHRYVLRGRTGAAVHRFHLNAQGEPPTRLHRFQVQPATNQEVLDWADAVYQSVPPVAYQPPADRWAYLPKTRARLEAGETLRVVWLGDSIANDTANSPVDVLLERAWPGARVEQTNVVRGGTGCTWYRQDNRAADLVLPHRPHLVILAGISHSHNEQAMQAVIQQIRQHAETPPEFIVSTGAISEDKSDREVVRGIIDYHRRRRGKPPISEKALDRILGFYDRVETMAAKEQAAFFPVREAWNAYLKQADKPVSFFRRDSIHANVRGRAVLARLWLRFLGPDEGSVPATQPGPASR